MDHMNFEGFKLTPRDSVDALRLMRKHQDVLIEPGDGDDVKEQIQGVLATYLSQKRAGATEMEFLDWYDNADMVAMVEGESADPTE
jgi:hypothetical protein